MVPLQPPGPGPDWKELMTPIQDDMARLEQERKTQVSLLQYVNYFYVSPLIRK